MKNFIKYAAVGLAGYFIGFYEMKYHVVKTIAMSKYKVGDDSTNSEEDES